MKPEQPTEHLPPRVAEYVDFVVRKTRYRKRVRRDVRRELTAHFQDALAPCANEKDRQTLADTLIEEFGDGKMLATLIRRGKKRCRPLWKKTIIRTMQAAGILILLAGLRVAHLSMGSPTVKVNYIEWLNEKVRDGRNETLNAKPHFDRAVELGTDDWPDVLDESDDYWPGDMNEPERQAVANFLAQNAQSLDALREAAAKPHFWLDYECDQDVPKGGTIANTTVANVMPFLSEYRKMARRLAAAIMWRTHEGDVPGAFDDSVLLLRLGRNLEGKGMLIEQLVGVAVEHLGWQAVTTVVARVDVPPNMLLRLQRTLEEISANGTLPITVSGEKVFWYDYVQRTFTDDGKGGGRMLPLGAPLVMSRSQDWIRGFVAGYPDRSEALAIIEGYFKQGEDNAARTPWELHQQEPQSHQKDKHFLRSMMLEILVPAHARTGQMAWRLRARRSAVVTILALKRWQLAKGEYPESLDELVAEKYLAALPQDPYSDAELKYERRGDDFVLYSLGADFDDDGGQDNQWGEGEGGGDRVFWPVESKKPEHKPHDVGVIKVTSGD